MDLREGPGMTHGQLRQQGGLECVPGPGENPTSQLSLGGRRGFSCQLAPASQGAKAARQHPRPRASRRGFSFPGILAWRNE